MKPALSSEILAGAVIVVVEDHDDTRKYLGIYLKKLGATVFLASNAAEGLEAVKINRPHLLISDILMPGEDGISLLRQIRSLESSAAANLPVIAMSAVASQIDKAGALNAGFQACLVKPVMPAKILETILAVLNR